MNKRNQEHTPNPQTKDFTRGVMMDTNNKLSVHRVFTGIYFVLALVTLIPTPTASKLSLLGYKALCSFSPISTMGLLALAGLHIYLQYRQTVSNKILS